LRGRAAVLATESSLTGHSPHMRQVARARGEVAGEHPHSLVAPRTSADEPQAERADATGASSAAPIGSFGDVYEIYFDFVWRSARRLGVPESSLDDVVQDVFVTV